VTDEAAAIEQMGLQPRLVLGSRENLKVTYLEDLAIAEAILARR
jgi:2-C-methyl-D-erythritol 4-phosphate cytidylyltransferase